MVSALLILCAHGDTFTLRSAWRGPASSNLVVPTDMDTHQSSVLSSTWKETAARKGPEATICNHGISYCSVAALANFSKRCAKADHPNVARWVVIISKSVSSQ
jgi:hypothetical protein